VNALLLPHPTLTAEQVELLCRRQGLVLAHVGRGRLMLVQSADRKQTMLRIASRAGPETR